MTAAGARKRRGTRGNPLLHAVDRYLGVPLVAAGALRRRRPLPPHPARIGVINSTNIGDTVLLSAVLSDLVAEFPQAQTTLFTAAAVLPVARLVPGIQALALQIENPRQAIATLRRERLDVLLDFDQWPRVEPVYCLVSGARWTAGFRAAGQHRHYAYDAAVDHSDSQHELENYRDLVRLLGVQSRSLPRLEAPGVLPPRRIPPQPYVVLHMWPTGVRSELKEWPADRWRTLAAELDALGYSIVLTGAPADSPRTKAFVESCGDLGGRLIDASGAYDLAEVVDLTAASRCVVSVNTGIMHLAAASGTATIGLNGPTSERRWGPVGRRAVSVNSTLPGCGYLHFGWEYRGRRDDCMHGIAVDRVLAAVMEVCDSSVIA